MPKGFFSQGMCLLTDGRSSIADIKAALESAGFPVIKEVPPQDLWCFGGASVLVPFRPEVNGGVTLDVVAHPWPDTMGDPKSDPMTFGAWSMGYFGPFAYPGSLARSGQHSWGWQAGRVVAQSHRGFIRLRSSYVGGAAKDAPILPKDYDPLAELTFLSRLVIALSGVPGVLCYYNPNGEVLRDLAGFRSTWDECTNQDKVPLLLWMNIRFFKLTDQLGFMDTVGNNQLDVTDVEAVFPNASYDPGTIDYYLRNVTHYLLGLGREIQTGEAIDGPGENGLSWVAEACETGIIAPPRQILRLYPKASRAAIVKALAAAKP